MKSWFGFGDLDLIFKVIADLNCQIEAREFLCALYHKLVGRFQPDLHGYNIGTIKSWFGFGDRDLFFKVTVGLKLPNLSQKVIVCTVSHEPAGGF